MESEKLRSFYGAGLFSRVPDNDVGGEGGVALGEMLSVNKTLQVLE